MGAIRRYVKDPPPDLARRHCWVLRTEFERGPFPGLILEWKKTNAGLWSARVVYVPDARGSRSVEAWFAEQLLQPIDHTSGSPR